MSEPRRRRKSLAVLAVFSALMAACGGGGGGDDATVVTPSGITLQIFGVPPSTILAGRAFSFKPRAQDAAGATFTFSVSGLPTWAQFDSATGRITGMPAAADVGAYPSIAVSVSDGATSAALPPFTVTVVATAPGAASLSWTPPTQRSDGSALTDLAGYRIHFGNEPGEYLNAVTVDNPGLASYVVDQLTPATWYFAVTAFDSSSVESAYSNEASKVVQ
jgi:hypothetical protein